MRGRKSIELADFNGRSRGKSLIADFKLQLGEKEKDLPTDW
jgi:hypothetical protein